MPELALHKLCFDAILVRKLGDSYNPMSIAEFVALSVDARIALLMQRKIRFFAGEEEVSVYEAVKSLDEARR